jgi:hypothetical protein
VEAEVVSSLGLERFLEDFLMTPITTGCDTESDVPLLVSMVSMVSLGVIGGLRALFLVALIASDLGKSIAQTLRIDKDESMPLNFFCLLSSL